METQLQALHVAKDRKGFYMHTSILMLSLAIIGGATLTVPVVENAGNRAILYWLVLPPLAVGAAVVLSQIAGI